MSAYQKIERDKFTTGFLEEGIIEIFFRSGKPIETDDIYELRKINLALSGHKPYAVLVLAEELTNFSKETRELLASKEFAGCTQAKALVFNGLGQKILGNFYLHVNKPHIKTRLFNDREKAINWLREIVKQMPR